MKNKDIFVEAFKQHINNRLEQSKIKITDLVLEELISFALEDSNHEHLYESGSHSKGKDISFEENGKSVKSAKASKTEISISSYRLTRFENNLDEMKSFIDNNKNFDSYFVLSRDDNNTHIKYTFYILPSDIFLASNMEWIEIKNKKGKFTGWKTINNNNIELSIIESMSSQLWIKLNKDYIKEYISFEIEKEISELGRNRFTAIL